MELSGHGSGAPLSDAPLFISLSSADCSAQLADSRSPGTEAILSLSHLLSFSCRHHLREGRRAQIFKPRGLIPFHPHPPGAPRTQVLLPSAAVSVAVMPASLPFTCSLRNLLRRVVLSSHRALPLLRLIPHYVSGEFSKTQAWLSALPPLLLPD